VEEESNRRKRQGPQRYAVEDGGQRAEDGLLRMEIGNWELATLSPQTPIWGGDCQLPFPLQGDAEERCGTHDSGET
jgi:hypothetical protein